MDDIAKEIIPINIEEELKNSYRGVLNDQINQHSLHKDQELRQKHEQLAINKQRFEMQREQEKMQKEVNLMQQAQYRQQLRDQQQTKGFGLQQLVGSPQGNKSPGPAKLR